MTVRAWTILLGALVLVACQSESPSAPSGGESITGSERFGWEQPAADAAELATFRYAIYVDDARSEATGVSCAAAPSPRIVLMGRGRGDRRRAAGRRCWAAAGTSRPRWPGRSTGPP